MTPIEQITNDELIKAISRLKEDNSIKAQKDYVECVMKAQFIMPVKAVAMPGEGDKAGAVKVNICILTNQEGKEFLPVFTSLVELEKGDYSDAQKAVITYKDLKKMILERKERFVGIAINPHSDNLIFPTALIDDIENDRGPFSSTGGNPHIKRNQIPANANIVLRTPKYMPVEMLEEAKKYLAGKMGVNRAYLQMMETNKSEDEYLIVIDCDDNVDEVALFGELIPIVTPYSFGIHVSVTSTGNELGMKVALDAEPFYEKE